jgi:4'-phosphopantetheinyl transferase
MGVLKIIQNGTSGKVGIWEIIENEEELFKLANLDAGEKHYLGQIKAEKRRKEWLSVRALVNTLMGKSCKITYQETGKPIITEHSLFISVSHTDGFVAVSLNNKEETGIDIQTKGDKINKIKHKFLGEAELACIKTNKDSEKLLVFWCAKESLYKLYGKKEVIFNKDLFISPFELETSGTLNGSVSKEELKNYLLHYYIFTKFVIVYVANEIKA